MNSIQVALFFLVLSFSVLLPQTVSANEQGFGVPKITAYPTAGGVSRIGKVTGQGCRSDNDCMVGCTAGQSDDLKCLTVSEASNECVSPDEAPKADYPCACLSDVNRCGFTFAKKAEPELDTVMPLTKPAPTKKHATTVKKPQHKKVPHKTIHKKKAAKAKPPSATPTAAPTPITKEPAHDSGQ